MIRAALFDLDGTLLDSLPDIAEAVNRLRRELGFGDIGEEPLRRWIGKGAEYLVAGALRDMPGLDVNVAAQRYIRHYLTLEQPRTRLYPGVRETLLALYARGFRMGVVTNKATASAEDSLARLLPDIPFDFVAGPERVSARKPHPAHALEVLSKIGARPRDAFLVGDDPVDAECARAAGVRFFAAVYGIGGARAPGAEIHEISELLMLV